MPNGETHDTPDPQQAFSSPYFEWALLLRVFGVAIRLRMLLLATVAVLISVAGWQLAGLLFLSGGDGAYLAEQSPEFRATAYQYSHLPQDGIGVGFGASEPTYELDAVDVDADDELEIGETEIDVDVELTVPGAGGLPIDGSVLGEPAYNVWRSLSEPFRQMFNLNNDYRRLAYFLFGGLWQLGLWAFFGSAMCRVSAMQLARGERVALGESLQFARRKWMSSLTAVLLPLFGVLAVSLPGLVLGWLMRTDIGLAIGGVLYVFVLLLSFLAALLAVGLWVGWPLMWAAIGVEASDSFDALSRSFAYVFQRPLHYLLYLAASSVVGLLGFVLVAFMCNVVVELGVWSTAWGAGADRVSGEALAGYLSNDDGSGAAATGAWFALMWTRLVYIIGTAYSYAFFFAMMTGIYLLLRRDVDQTETDEIFLDEEDEDLYGLPPLETDAAGVPDTMDEQSKSEAEGATEEPPKDEPGA